MIDTYTGFTFVEGPGKPRVSLTAAMASGDDNASDQDMGTFNSLYERADYFFRGFCAGQT